MKAASCVSTSALSRTYPRFFPKISAWDAATYMAMGVAAHKSAQKDGEIVKVADFGKVWD